MAIIAGTETIARETGRTARMLKKWAGIAVQGAFGVAKAAAKPAVAHLAGHAYTLAGFGLISAASFVHSTFTGLLVSGILVLVFEWKVGD